MLFAILFILISISNQSKIEIKDSWVRTGGEGLNSALYFKIENNGNRADTLYKVTSNIAGLVQIHETYKKNDMMGMREIKNLVIKPHSKIEFKPGSFHVMLMNLTKDLKVNDQITFSLFFKSSGEMKIKAKVVNK